ncbi:recombinase family protein [Paremcibacter congregatus]|uniref:Resolvase n=1 Tax=Paremcibacter congregatus TaxID=2043170 RepID=A0A2G4YUB6_9PROT|nr:recombinase family protein [Paremcibacter congregatus]PHZ85932.1 resolvase [Paremcibacter congregatus]QDE26897.1 resolvase [Paremcibacter congregatus]
MRVALYLRVSTNEQTTENQLRDLRDVATRQGWDLIEIYEDHGISGAKDRDKRPAYDAMLKAATQRKFDMIMAWSVDRLGRSLKGLVGFMDELNALNVDLYLHQQALNTSTPAGKAMFQMCGVFAEFERSMIQERVKAGLQRAKANGKILGRRPVGPEKEDLIRTLRGQGMGIHRIAKTAKVGVSVVQRVIN